MKVMVNISPRTRFLVLASLALIPLLGIMSLVLVSTYFPVFKAMDNIVYESMEEMMPLVRLENALHRSVMPPNDYLIHQNPEERENWKRLIASVDNQLQAAMEKMKFEEERSALQEIEQSWQQRRSEGWAIINNPEGLSALQLGEAMEQFDANMYQLIDQIEVQHEEMHQFIHHEYLRTKGLKTRALLVTVLTLLVTLAGGFYASLYLNRDRKKLVAENEQDPLTGVHNRRAFEARVKSLERYTLTLINTHYSMVMFDIDHFKKINDQYGHQTGDTAICHISHLVEKMMREDDFLARWGGEEFVLLLQNTDKNTAAKVAERVRTAIMNHPVLAKEQGEIALTVSLGVSTYPEDGTNADEILEAADTALYRAKGNGRNCVMMA